MHRLTFDPGQCRVLLLVINKSKNSYHSAKPFRQTDISPNYINRIWATALLRQWARAKARVALGFGQGIVKGEVSLYN